MEMFRLDSIRYTYPASGSPALDDVSLEIPEGEFVLVCGPSGGGKTTLARLLGGFLPGFHGGTLEGLAEWRGKAIGDWGEADLRRSVGMVFQTPERQLLTHTVENEIVFGLENLGTPVPEMRRVLAEVGGFFHLTSLLDHNPQELSGGEQQRVAVASMVAMAGNVLILDEPTSQLDPVAAGELFRILRDLNRELGLTVILVEQRLGECFPLADRVLLVEGGRVPVDEEPEAFVNAVRDDEDRSAFLPEVTRLFLDDGVENPPLTVGSARRRRDELREPGAAAEDDGPAESKAAPFLRVESVAAAYELGVDVLRDVSLEVASGEIHALLGENGAGKSTLLTVILDPARARRGTVRIGEREAGRKIPHRDWMQGIGYLSQRAEDHLVHESVEEELAFTLRRHGREFGEEAEDLLERLRLADLRERSPRELSAGERQRVALASVVVAEPELLLVDEPTRGLDPQAKEEMAIFFREFARDGGSVLLVTQDVEFAAAVADRVSILFRGEVAVSGTPGDVFEDGLLWAPAAVRVSRAGDRKEAGS